VQMMYIEISLHPTFAAKALEKSGIFMNLWYNGQVRYSTHGMNEENVINTCRL